MNVDGVVNGIVLDHIKAGQSLKVYNLLGLDKLKSSVALIQNVKSQKMGKKDILKIDEEVNIDLTILGFFDEKITVNIVQNGNCIKKMKLSLPKKIKGYLKCKNPRCITTVEQEICQEFSLVDADKKVYRCIYCDSEYVNV